MNKFHSQWCNGINLRREQQCESGILPPNSIWNLKKKILIYDNSTTSAVVFGKLFKSCKGRRQFTYTLVVHASRVVLTAVKSVSRTFPDGKIKPIENRCFQKKKKRCIQAATTKCQYVPVCQTKNTYLRRHRKAGWQGGRQFHRIPFPFPVHHIVRGHSKNISVYTDWKKKILIYFCFTLIICYYIPTGYARRRE